VLHFPLRAAAARTRRPTFRPRRARRAHHVARATLGAFADRELARPSARVVARHVASCGTCRARLASLHALSAAVARAAAVTPAPDTLRARVGAALALAGAGADASASRP
jgi:anti-sigma factor RsiW